LRRWEARMKYEHEAHGFGAQAEKQVQGTRYRSRMLKTDEKGSKYPYAALEAGLRIWGAGIEYEREARGFGTQPPETNAEDSLLIWNI
jgi:hypothetical protein